MSVRVSMDTYETSMPNAEAMSFRGCPPLRNALIAAMSCALSLCVRFIGGAGWATCAHVRRFITVLMVGRLTPNLSAMSVCLTPSDERRMISAASCSVSLAK